jgi:hypothetical protein
MGYETPAKATKPVVDLRSDEEMSLEQDAQRPLSEEDEHLSRKLVVLLQNGADQHRLKQSEALEKTSSEIKAIGRNLFSNGGHRHMQKIYYRVHALGGKASLFDVYWDGIGEWEG